MKPIIRKILTILSVLLLIICTSCEVNEPVLLTKVFFGEDGNIMEVYSYLVVEDLAINSSVSSNRNKLINRGEHIYLNLSLKNLSVNKIERVSINVSSKNKYILSIQPNYKVFYGDILKNEEISCRLSSQMQSNNYYAFSFQLDKNLPQNENITFQIEIYSNNKLIDLLDFSPKVY